MVADILEFKRPDPVAVISYSEAVQHANPGCRICQGKVAMAAQWMIVGGLLFIASAANAPTGEKDKVHDQVSRLIMDTEYKRRNK